MRENNNKKSLFMKKAISTSFFIAILFIPCKGQSNTNQNLEILNTVWETINTEYFDSTFGGLDWQKEYEYYKPIIEACKSNDSLYYHLNKMLFKLDVSHLGVVSQEEVNRVGPPQLFLDGTLGLDVRFLNEKAIIISVAENSSAEEEGLKRGYEVLEINKKSILQIVTERKSEPTPPFNERNLKSMITQDFIRGLYGIPNEKVSLVYLDEKNIKHHVELTLKEQTIRKASILPNLPEIYARVNGKIFNNKIGYIRFDVFHPVILDAIVNLITKYNNLSSLILDIRGNPGGEFRTRKTIAEQFVTERTLFWRYHHRNEIREVFLDPVQQPYEGKVVILIDEMSGSSSEEFSGGMKAFGRATVIGQRTVGKVLTMEVVSLPEGALFIYPNSQTRTAKNEILEGVGVIPDVIVELTKETLLKDRDIQLETAIEYLMKI